MTVPAQLTDLRETLTSVGTARALKSVSVYAETSGRVTAVAIDADTAVAEGDLLLQLDDRDEMLGSGAGYREARRRQTAGHTLYHRQC